MTNVYVSALTVDGISLQRTESLQINEFTEGETQGFAFRFVKNKNSDNGKYEEGEKNPNVITVNYTVGPENASNKKLRYEVGTNFAGKTVIDEENNTITFLESCGGKITLRTTDGSQISVTIIVYAVA